MNGETNPEYILWGKSGRSGGPSLLIQHLFDTAATAELVWDHYLSEHVHQSVDEVFAGQGRLAFAWIAGVHDLGKATPAFQALDPELGLAVAGAGLRVTASHLPHPVSGYIHVANYLKALGWKLNETRWYPLLVLGHHGKFIVPGQKWRDAAARDGSAWVETRERLIGLINSALGVESPPAPRRMPTRAVQLAMSAAVSMADWIASNTEAFPPVWLPERPTYSDAQRRARHAWDQLGLRGGWQADSLRSGDLMSVRFGRAARPVQRLVQDVAAEEPLLLIVEAPTGEGKTEAALVAAELLAGQRGSDGIFVGMPTQATSDPMFGRVLDWLAQVDAECPVGLLHGKRQLNPDWIALQRSVEMTGVDEFGCDDPYQLPTPGSRNGSRAPAQWFLGSRRGLLMPSVVGTIDQLLMAATRTRYVGFRHLGLAGKVVILDEVHACDVYMSQFLTEALRWLGDARVPVIVLTATLPPAMRLSLLRAYAQGLTQTRDIGIELHDADGYPRLTWIREADPGQAHTRVVEASQSDRRVRIEMLAEGPEWEGLRSTLDDYLTAGGTALVVCNTVRRAQGCFQSLKEVFADDVVLLHGRLAAGERSARTQALLEELGPPEGDVERPHRRVVVSTQVAEQSFDIDVDLLVTEIAPMDLLIQRAGRLHRHARPHQQRGERVSEPRMLVMGISEVGEVPEFDGGSEYVYGRWPLLSSAANVMRSDEWMLPSQAPHLVQEAYERTSWPDGWQGVAATARDEQVAQDARRRGVAAGLLLAGEDDLSAKDLSGLHERDTDDSDLEAVVRDGERSSEVVLVRRSARDRYLTLDGADMGMNGELVWSDDEVLAQVIGSTVRLPAYSTLTEAVTQSLSPLPGWLDHPWLGSALALELRAEQVELGGYLLSYDMELGLVAQKVGSA